MSGAGVALNCANGNLAAFFRELTVYILRASGGQRRSRLVLPKWMGVRRLLLGLSEHARKT